MKLKVLFIVGYFLVLYTIGRIATYGEEETEDYPRYYGLFEGQWTGLLVMWMPSTLLLLT